MGVRRGHLSAWRCMGVPQLHTRRRAILSLCFSNGGSSLSSLPLSLAWGRHSLSLSLSLFSRSGISSGMHAWPASDSFRHAGASRLGTTSGKLKLGLGVISRTSLCAWLGSRLREQACAWLGGGRLWGKACARVEEYLREQAGAWPGSLALDSLIDQALDPWGVGGLGASAHAPSALLGLAHAPFTRACAIFAPMPPMHERLLDTSPPISLTLSSANFSDPLPRTVCGSREADRCPCGVQRDADVSGCDLAIERKCDRHPRHRAIRH